MRKARWLYILIPSPSDILLSNQYGIKVYEKFQESICEKMCIRDRIVNVYSGEIYDGGVAVAGGQIAAVGDVAYTVGPDTRIICLLYTSRCV